MNVEVVLKRLGITDVLNRDFGDVVVTEENRRRTVRLCRINPTEDYGFNQGRFYTDKEYADRRKRIMEMKLP